MEEEKKPFGSWENELWVGNGEAWGGGQGWRKLNNGKWEAQIGPWRHCSGHGPAEKKEKTLYRAGGLIRYTVLC